VIDEDINERMARLVPQPGGIGEMPSQIPLGISMTPTFERPNAAPDIDTDYADAARRIADSRRTQMMSSLVNITAVDPDSAARSQKLGSQFGVGGDLAARNAEELRQRAFIDSISGRDMLRRNPVLADYIAQRQFAEIAHDDVDALAKTEQEFSKGWFARFDRPVSEVVSEGIAGIGEGFGRAVAQDEMASIYERQRQRGGRLEVYEKAALDSYREEMAKGGERTGFLEEAAYIGSQQLTGAPRIIEAGMMGATAGGGLGLVGGPAGFATVPAGMATGFAAGLAAGAFENSRRLETAMLYGELQPELGHESADRIATTVGIFNAALDTGAAALVAKPFAGLLRGAVRQKVSEAIRQQTTRAALANAAKAYGIGVAGEVTTETVQELNNVIGSEIGRYLADKPMEIETEEGREAIATRLVDTFVATAMGMSIMGAPGPAGRLYVDTRAAKQGEQQAAKLQSMVKAIADNKLLARSPERLEEFAESAVEGTDSETTYVNAAVMHDILRQSGITEQEMDTVLPGVRAQLTEMQQNGIDLGNNDVTVPTAQMTVRLQKTPLLNQILPHARLSPDAMSITEVQQFEANREQLVAEARQIMEARQETDATFVAEAQAIEDRIFGEVTAAGGQGMNEQEARANAQFVRDMYVTMAARMNISPAEAYRQFQYRVQGAEANAQSQQASVTSAERQARSKLFGWYAQRELAKIAESEGIDLSTLTREQYAQYAIDKGLAINDDHLRMAAALRNAKSIEEYAAMRKSMRAAATPMQQQADAAFAAFAQRVKRDAVASTTIFPGVRIRSGTANSDTWLYFKVNSGATTAGDTYKAYAGFTDPYKSFTQERIEQFLQFLQSRGYNGDVKTIQDIDQGSAISDQIVMHGATKADADLALQLSQEFFGNELNFLESGMDTDSGSYSQNLAAKIANDIAAANQQQVVQQAASASQLNQAATIDADYLAAVERGDMETAQRMVDEQTKLAQPKVEQELRSYAKDLATLAQQIYDEWDQDADGHSEELGTGGICDLISSAIGSYLSERGFDIQDGGHEGDDHAWIYASKHGATFAVDIAPDTYEIGGGYSWRKRPNVVFDGNHIDIGSVTFADVYGEPYKPDPVTYDEQGNVVPLSRRFDITSPKLFEQAAVVPATIDAASNVESSFAFAGTQTFRNNRQFKKAIQDRVNTAAKDAGIDLTQFTPEVEQYLVRVAVADAITALRTNPNAVGWYNEKVTKALRLVSLIHPEIATDPRAKFAFTWALAVTSNGLKVDKNFELAERAYAEYKRTGKMPTNVGAGTAQIAINESLGLFNELVEKYGIDEVEKFMTSKTTVKEVIAYTNKNVSGENLTTEVYGAAALGPKIGNGFFANLYGHFEQLTMDRWLMRTWGRWTGTLLEDNERNIVLKREQLAGIIKAMPAKNRKQLEAIVGMPLATDDLDSLATAINKASLKKENRVEMAKIGVADEKAQAKFSKILGEPTRGVQRISYGDEFRKLGNSLAKYLDGQKEAPSGPPERARIRKVFAQALAELQTQFPSLTMSDLQALLWYPEKRLYDAAKTADEGQTGYEDNAAPDYANSAAKLAIAKGISQDVVNATIGEVDAELAAIAAERTTGAERGIGNLVLRQDARLAGAGFEQAARGPARGGFDPRRLTTILNKNADLSTFLHETAHFYLHVLGQMASDPAATPEIRADMDTLLSWFGIAGDTAEARLAAWNAMSIDQQRKYHEQFAYSFEVYLFDGKSPSVEMQGLFERFSSWLRRVYKSIRDDLNAIYRREFGEDLPILTGEVRQVMDRMLATEEQIKRQAAINEMKPQFQTLEQALASGMTEAEYAAYQVMQQEAMDAAVTDITKASLRQMQWLGNARSRLLRDLQRKHDRQRKEVRDEVAEEIRLQPVYRAMEYLRTGTLINFDGETIKPEGPHRLDMEAVRNIYAGMPTPESLEAIRATGMAMPTNVAPDIAALGTGGKGMMGKDGINPDVAAELFGYSSGDALIRALLAATPMKEAIEARTDEVMLARFSDLVDPKARDAAVQTALHNEARARFVAVELRFVAKATQPTRVLIEAARQAAREMIAGKRIVDVKPQEFIAAESRAARDAADLGKYEAQAKITGKAEYDRVRLAALAAGSTEEDAVRVAEEAQAAFVAARTAEREAEFKARFGASTVQQALIRAKRAQLYQNQLAAEALRVREEVGKGVKYLKQVLRDSNVKRMGADYADQIERILERFNLARLSVKARAERQSLVEWLAKLEQDGLVPDLAPEVIDEANRKPYQEMTVAEFRDLVEAVKQLEYVGKNAQKIKRAEEMAEFNEVRDEIVDSIKSNYTGKVTKPRTPTTAAGRRIAGMKRFLYSHLKAAAIARIFDGGKDDGPVWRYLIRTANDAGDMETRMRAEATKRLTEILAPVFKLGKMGGKGVYFPTIGQSLNREARLVIALNMGNDGNRQRLLDGEGWTLEQLTPVLESLTEAEWNAVQQVWDFLETYRPLIAAKERRLYGKEPNWVTPTPFTVRTADGKEVRLSGGYYPIKYDPVATERAETAEEAEAAKAQLRSAYTAATTRRSFTKARARQVRGRPLLYTMSGVYGGVNDVIHDLSWHEWLIQANRLMRDEKFSSTVRETYGVEAVRQLKDWIKDNAAGEQAAQGAADQAASVLRRSVSAAGLGFNVVSAALQVTGFSQSIVRVGAKHIARGVALTVGSPIATFKAVNEKSSFMAERSRTQFRELNELRNMVQDESASARRLRLGTYFLMMRMQRMVDVPTWVGAYEKALEAGKDEDTAVALADQAVIDSQGGGMLKDLSAAERGGPVSKLFTVFYSYMNTVYNMGAVSTMTPRSKGRLASDYLMLFVVPVVLNYALKNALTPDVDDEEPDLETIAKDLIAEELAFLMGMMVVVREFQNVANVVTGKETGARGYEGPAGLRGIGETMKFATQASQGEFDRAFRKSAINMLGLSTGTPSAQINRTLDGIEALAEGEVENPLAPLTGVKR